MTPLRDVRGGRGQAEPDGERATPIAVRVYRVLRAGLHLAQGLATIAFVFPWIAHERRFHLIRTWSAGLLRVFAIEARTEGGVHGARERGLMLVANHVSWLDIFVLHAIQPSRFVAKAELRRWPLIGWLIVGVGTLFIERERRRHTHAVNEAVRSALARGDVVAVFPEGRTTDGTSLLPFHGSLLQPVVDLEGWVQPVAIRYRSASGEPTLAAAYHDVSFLVSVWRIASQPVLRVDVRFTPALDAAGNHRRELARAAERAIRAVLE